MNNLKLKKMGVQELNAKEMVEIEGGAKLLKVTGLLGWIGGGNSWGDVEIELLGIKFK